MSLCKYRTDDLKHPNLDSKALLQTTPFFKTKNTQLVDECTQIVFGFNSDCNYF